MKKTHSKFILQNLRLLLVPIWCSILAFGLVSTSISVNFYRSEINKSNQNLLAQAKERIEDIMHEAETISLDFGQNPNITYDLKRDLDDPSLSSDEINELEMFESILSAPANSKSYIQSIYIYFNNPQNRFLSSNDNLISLSETTDQGWYASYLKHKQENDIWCEVRNLSPNSVAEKSSVVLTVYKNIMQTGFTKRTGVIVLNAQMDSIVGILNDNRSYKGQCYIIADRDGNTLCSTDSHIANAIKSKKAIPGIQLVNGKLYEMKQLNSPEYNLKFISLIPLATLYEVPVKLVIVTFLFLILSLVVETNIAAYVTNRNYKQIKSIIELIADAESGNPPKPLKRDNNDEFGFIMNNIVKTFIEQNYLKVQLSEKKYKEKVLELTALQSQINPHFLFNTLQTISFKVLGLFGKYNEANQMLEDLSSILKYSLSDPNKAITLADEVDNVKSYIEIQKIRFKEIFDVYWDYNEDLSQYQIIKLVLQPIVENAISHNRHRKHTDIRIKIRFPDNLIKISITDNGSGMNHETLSKLRNLLSQDTNFSDHIGLYNTNKRIKLCYGDAYSLHILSKENFGTSVRITLPKQHT